MNNINELIAQQQQMLNQQMQTAHKFQWGMIALSIAGFLISWFVIYLFYARLRDISEELRKLRISYEMANPPHAQGSRQNFTNGFPPITENPFSKGDSKYMPQG
jgi:hypothetical protein